MDKGPFYPGAGPRRDKDLADAEAKSLGTSPAPTPPPAPTSPPAPEKPSLLERAKKAIGFQDGGEVDYRRGGQVRQGTTATADDVPALLSKGEYVLPADTVKAVGAENLEHLRESTHNPENRAGRSHGKRGFT